MFEIDYEPKQKVKIFGKEYELSKPTTKQARQMLLSLEEAGNSQGKGIEVMLDLLNQLGLPKEIAEEVPTQKLNDLLLHVIGSKKN